MKRNAEKGQKKEGLLQRVHADRPMAVALVPLFLFFL
jgi:hypothetical protein